MLENAYLPDLTLDVLGLPGMMQSTSIAKDGNCLFRAMSYHIHGTQELHMETRAKAVAYLQTRPDLVEAFVVEGSGHLGAGTYLAEMAKPGTWGDELALLALAEAHGISLWVYSDQSGQHSTYPGGASGP